MSLFDFWCTLHSEHRGHLWLWFLCKNPKKCKAAGGSRMCVMCCVMNGCYCYPLLSWILMASIFPHITNDTTWEWILILKISISDKFWGSWIRAAQLSVLACYVILYSFSFRTLDPSNIDKLSSSILNVADFLLRVSAADKKFLTLSYLLTHIQVLVKI